MKKQLTLPTVILFLYAAAICFNGVFQHRLLSSSSGADIIERMFGSLRIFVGDWAFMKAEEYHHRGLPFAQALAYHEGESILGEAHSGTDKHEHEENSGQVSRNASLYEKLYAQVKVTADSHMKPEEEKEVLPWFYVEVAFNPHDIRGYVLGAYWLYRIGEEDESFKFLREGEANNPDSAQIIGAIGKAYYKKNDYKNAAMYLERACKLWVGAKGINIVTSSYEESDRLFSFDLLAEMYSKKGEREKALQLYKELLKFGTNPVVLQKMKKIEAGL
jgi:tetratricopeptide (TPR) repeat protein